MLPSPLSLSLSFCFSVHRFTHTHMSSLRRGAVLSRSPKYTSIFSSGQHISLASEIPLWAVSVVGRGQLHGHGGCEPPGLRIEGALCPLQCSAITIWRFLVTLYQKPRIFIFLWVLQILRSVLCLGHWLLADSPHWQVGKWRLKVPIISSWEGEDEWGQSG